MRECIERALHSRTTRNQRGISNRGLTYREKRECIDNGERGIFHRFYQCFKLLPIHCGRCVGSDGVRTNKRIKGVANNRGFLFRHSWISRGQGKKREECGKRRWQHTAKGYQRERSCSVISPSPGRESFFSGLPLAAQLRVATYRMRSCVEIKYSRRELRPPLGLVVAWNSFDFIFALICLGNRKYASRFAHRDTRQRCIEEKKIFTHETNQGISRSGEKASDLQSLGARLSI